MNDFTLRRMRRFALPALCALLMSVPGLSRAAPITYDITIDTAPLLALGLPVGLFSMSLQDADMVAGNSSVSIFDFSPAIDLSFPGEFLDGAAAGSLDPAGATAGEVSLGDNGFIGVLGVDGGLYELPALTGNLWTFTVIADIAANPAGGGNDAFFIEMLDSSTFDPLVANLLEADSPVILDISADGCQVRLGLVANDPNGQTGDSIAVTCDRRVAAPPSQHVSEPASLALLLAGLGLVAGASARRARAA